jgi:hypothetical protein
VMMHCQVDEVQGVAFNFKVEPPPPVALAVDEAYEDLAVSSIALLYDEDNRYAPDLSDVLSDLSDPESNPAVAAAPNRKKGKSKRKMKSAQVQTATSEAVTTSGTSGTVKFRRKGHPVLVSVVITALVLIGGVASLGAWHHFHPKTFWQAVDRVLGSEASELSPDSQQQE